MIKSVSLLHIFFISVLMMVLPVHAEKRVSVPKKFHDFVVTDIDGKPYQFSQLKGKKVMVVNVASKCGLTPQYEELQKLYEIYRDKDFVIVAFPSSNFRDQEFGTNTEIKDFCTENYAVTFPMMAKIDVTGTSQAAIYKWLTLKKHNGFANQEVTWNFQKYLIDEKGHLIGILMPKESPLDKKVIDWLNAD